MSITVIIIISSGILSFLSCEMGTHLFILQTADSILVWGVDFRSGAITEMDGLWALKQLVFQAFFPLKYLNFLKLCEIMYKPNSSEFYLCLKINEILILMEQPNYTTTWWQHTKVTGWFCFV